MKKHNQELEIDEDIALEEKNWVLQRIAWVLMAIIVLAALLGYTGDGGWQGISRFKAGGSSEGIEAEYDRFLRRKAPAELTVTLYPVGRQASHELQFSKDFYEKVQIEQVIPEPLKVYTQKQGITYQFAGTATQSVITFYLKPKHMGTLDMEIQTQGRQLRFTQFIYP